MVGWQWGWVGESLGDEGVSEQCTISEASKTPHCMEQAEDTKQVVARTRRIDYSTACIATRGLMDLADLPHKRDILPPSTSWRTDVEKKLAEMASNGGL